ncbi:MAG: class I SAM-dependent methyltransferase [Planctomycetota bacterium]
MPKFQELDWYDAPKYYDAIFDESTDEETDFLEAAFEEYARVPARSRARRVLEPACGSGRLLESMARRGWSVAGFDLSLPMLEHARRRLEGAGVPRSRYRLFDAAMQDFAVKQRFQLAHCLVSTFKYLLTEKDARAHLERVAEHLVPGGIYVLGFHLSEYDDESISRERWVARRRGFEVTCTIQGWPPDARTRTERVRSRLAVRENRGGERRLETNWTFRTYDGPQVRRLLRSVPALELVAVHDFSYDLATTRELGEERLDTVLVLRRR